jgi:hypothetical protein
MYPDGTWGAPPRNATAAERFAAAYHRRFQGRNALTCFISGVGLCDSIGALTRSAAGANALRRARYNLAHRYAVFGLTSRSEESMAIIAWVFGWLPFLESHLDIFREPRRIIPGSQHRRLSLPDLCTVPGLRERMQLAEADDIALYRFAAALYTQRLAHVPAEVLALAKAPRWHPLDATSLECAKPVVER